VAVFWVSLTCTVISVDDGLLRTSTGCTGPAFSPTLYVDWIKLTEKSMHWITAMYINAKGDNM